MEAWIIEELEEQKRAPERPQLQLPINFPRQEEEDVIDSEPRGVITINIFGDEDDEE